MIGIIGTLVLLALVLWSIAVVNLYLFLIRRQRLLANLRKSFAHKSDNFSFKSPEEVIWQAGVLLKPIGRRISFQFLRQQINRYSVLAGKQDLDTDTLLGLCFGLGVTGLITGNLLIFTGVPLGNLIQIFLTFGGFTGPVIWLRLKARKRQEEISLALPDFLDTLSIVLTAGVPFDRAISYLVRGTDGPLAEELGILQKEQEVGLSREEAYSRMIARNDCRELETMTFAINQGSKLGVPIARTFKVLAEDLRVGRINNIKEKAGRAAPKITLITSFVILPAVLFGIFGLIVLNLIYNPQGLGLSGLIL